ncbi:MAG: VOC family protein, partial [Alkalispirochaeta sp.]
MSEARTDVTGIHHITAIAGTPQENLDFYVGTLGLRLVKRSINQDAPDTYHLFFADGKGNPGTDLTFFPWPQMGPGETGTGVWGEVSFVIPPGSIDWWEERLRNTGTSVGKRETRFGETVLPFADPHGMELSLTETEIAKDQPFAPWRDSPVPEERQIRALGAVTLTLRSEAATTGFLADAFGFSFAAEDGRRRRYTVGDGAGGQRLDLIVDPDARRGSWGV